MHYAARKGKVKVCRLIMENVHGKNPPTNFGWTPLHQAEGEGPEKRSGHKRPREAADLPESSTADTQEDETTEKVLSDANEVVENTKVTVQEHTIVVDGSELSERKELEFVVDGNSEGQSTIKHTRKIDGQQYTVIEKRKNGQFKSTETITMMTPDELTAFKEKWRIMWHPEMTEDEILDLVDQEGHTSGEPEVQTEATRKTQLPQAREESRKEAKPDKKKKVFWCCC